MSFFKTEINFFSSSSKTEFISINADRFSVRAFSPDAAEEPPLVVLFMTKEYHSRSLKLLTANIHDFIRLQQLLIENNFQADRLKRSDVEHVFSQAESDFNYNITLHFSEDIKLVNAIFNKKYTSEELNSESYKLPEHFLTGLRNVIPGSEYSNEQPHAHVAEQKNEKPTVLDAGVNPQVLSVFKPLSTFNIAASADVISEKNNKDAWWRAS